MKYGRKAIATSPLPNPARPSTRLAAAMTRAHAAQSSVTETSASGSYSRHSPFGTHLVSLPCRRIQHPRVVQRDLAQVVVSAGGAAMDGVHVDLEERGGGAGVQRAQLGHPLGGLPVHDLAVVERRLDEDGWIRASAQVRVRAVGLHVLVLLADLRVAPFLELDHREG